MVAMQKLWWWLITQLWLRFRIKRVGLKSYVARPLFIYGGKGIEIESEVRIFPFARLETHFNGKIHIGQDVSIGQNFHVTSAESTLEIGAHTTILGNAFITNIDHEYQQINVHIFRQPYLIRETRIGDNCFIGYGAAIQAGTILGRQCVVGAHSVVRGTFPDYCVIVGAPARIVKRYDPLRHGWFKTDPQGQFIS